MYSEILDLLPYKSTFRFVDEITFLDDNEVKGNYTLQKDSFFYNDHFPGNPVTPGVILTEIMAQIGVVVMGLHLLKNGNAAGGLSTGKKIFPVLSATDVSFNKMVLPGEKVSVISQKEYFRFNKLKCKVEMYNASQELVAKGVFSGFIKQMEK